MMKEIIKRVVKDWLPPAVTRLVRNVRKRQAPSTNRPALTSKDKAIVETARGHFLHATQPSALNVSDVRPSERWQTIQLEIRNRILTATSPWDVIDYAQRVVEFDDRRSSVDIGWFLRMYQNTLISEFPQFADCIRQMGDSPYSHTETLCEFDGRLVNNVYFEHLRTMLLCLAHVKSTQTVCEIGGGYGDLARLWLTNPIRPAQRYLIVDFPESLFFAEVFLRTNLNVDDGCFRYVQDSVALDLPADPRPSIILCPIQHAAALARTPMDVIVNTGSMQEMTDEAIDTWMNWLGRQDCRYFYSLNYFAQPLSNMCEGANVWSPRLGPEWTVRLQVADAAAVREHTTRNYADILAEKTGVRALSDEEIMTRYRHTKDRILDNQCFLEAMDLVRLNPTEEIVWDLLNRCLAERAAVPKEAYWLAQHLSKHARAAFLGRHGQKVSEIFRHLTQIRYSGNENMYDPQRLNAVNYVARAG